MANSHCYWHLVNKNGNFTLLLTSSGQEWQLAGLPLWSAGRSTLQMHHGIYIMGCIWQSFWILQEKLGISFFFWIIRFVNSQLALYSHVRCNPPQHPPDTCQMKVTNIRCEMKYPDKLSDIPPENLSDEVTNIRCEMMYPDQLSDMPPAHRTCQMKWPI